MDNDRYSARLVWGWPCARLRLACGVLLGAGLAACATSSPSSAAARVEPPAASVAPAVLASAEPLPPIAAPAAIDEAPAAEKIRVEAHLPIIDEASNVFFASRSARIDATGQQTLRAIAERVAGNRPATVLLIGHSDGQGSRSYNLAITEERLAAVSKLLRSYGVAAHQLRRSRVGSIRSAPECNDEACWRRARRIELVVTP